MMKIALLTGMLVTAMAASAPAAPAEDDDTGHSTGNAIADGECPSYCPYNAAGAFHPDAIGNPKNNATCASVAARNFRIAKTKAASETGHSLVDECLYAEKAIFAAGCCNKDVYPCEICPEGRINEDDITFNTTAGDKRTCGAALTEFDNGLYIKKSTCKGINSYLVCAGCCIAPEVEEIHHEEDSYSGHGEDHESAYGYGDDDHGDSHDDHGDSHDDHGDSHDDHSDAEDSHADHSDAEDSHDDHADADSHDDHGDADADSHDDHSDAEDSHDDHADADTHDEETHTEEEHAVETHDEETHTEEEHAEETHDDTDDGQRRRMASSGGGSAANDPAPADVAGCVNKWEGGSKNYETGKCSCKPPVKSYLYEDEENSSFSAAPVLLSALLPAAILYVL